MYNRSFIQLRNYETSMKLFIYLLNHSSIHSFAHSSIYTFHLPHPSMANIHPFIHLSSHLSVCPSACMPLHPSIYLHTHTHLRTHLIHIHTHLRTCCILQLSLHYTEVLHKSDLGHLYTRLQATHTLTTRVY